MRQQGGVGPAANAREEAADCPPPSAAGAVRRAERAGYASSALLSGEISAFPRTAAATPPASLPSVASDTDQRAS